MEPGKQEQRRNTIVMQRNKIFCQSLKWSAALTAALAVLLMPAQAQDDPPNPPADEPTIIEIQCAPAVVNLNSKAGGNWMTVHTDLPFPGEGFSVEAMLNEELPAKVIKSDDCGDLVAKFELSALKAGLADLPQGTVAVELKLTVTVTDEATGETEIYEGFDTVRVIQPPKITPGKNARQNKYSAEQPRRVGKPQK